MLNCDGGASSVPCTNPAEYKNPNSLYVCSFHKSYYEHWIGFEERDRFGWVELTAADETFDARYGRLCKDTL